jgi:hypothetical protein
MINSTSSSDRTIRPDAIGHAPVKSTVRSSGADQFSAANSEALKGALASNPEIRPEVVARGRELASDPSYPSLAVLRQVGQKILNSPDLSAETA